MKHYASKELITDLCNLLDKYKIESSTINTIISEMFHNDCEDTQTFGASTPSQCCNYYVTKGNSEDPDILNNNCECDF
jgi:hypothetical protein